MKSSFKASTLPNIIWSLCVGISLGDASFTHMRQAIGFILILWVLSKFFATAFFALDGAARESFKLIEASAVVSQQKVLQQK